MTGDCPIPWPGRGDLTFIANPNSPSGTVIPPAEIARLADQIAPRRWCWMRRTPISPRQNGLDLPRVHENVIVTRTLSKSYSLAGIRFGFAIARPEVVRELVKVKDSYNCDVLSLAAATAAIEDQEYFREVRAKIIATRERMRPALAALGFDVTPSHANFLWCRQPTGR